MRRITHGDASLLVARRANNKDTMATPLSRDIVPAWARRVPTTIQRRLEWVPAIGSAFWTVEGFEAQFKVYMFATGRYYGRRWDDAIDHTKEAFFGCYNCYEEGMIHLQFKQCQDQPTKCWIVEYIHECECGPHTTPSPWVNKLKETGLSALTNQIVGTKVSLKLLGTVCFPAGYVSVRGDTSGSRHVGCKRINCQGKLIVKTTNKRSYGGQKLIQVESAVECCWDCRNSGTGEPFVVKQSARTNDLKTCIICCQENLQDWVTMPCGQETCKACLERLVHLCPVEIKRVQNVVVFKPHTNPRHCYTCPFCKSPFYPKTVIETHSRVLDQEFMKVNTVTNRWKVEQLVDTPYAYQSFDMKSPRESVTEQEYPAVMLRYHRYLRERYERITLDSVREELPYVDPNNYERLRVLRRSGLFRKNMSDIANFVDACEFLYDCGVDSGLLREVASADGPDSRLTLMRPVYEDGWGGTGVLAGIFDKMITSLLVRKGVVRGGVVGRG